MTTRSLHLAKDLSLPVDVVTQTIAVLRQPPARPKSVAIPKDGVSSWWVTAPREGFSDVAASHQDRMHASKFGSPTGSANIITADLERRLRADAKARREMGR